MRKHLLLSLIVVILTPCLALHAQSKDCLSPRFFGGQYVRVTGSRDAGGLPFRDKLGLSEPVLGFIQLDTVIISAQMERCVEGRNWYSVWYASDEGEEPDEVWVVDGDGQTYWLEPVPDCPLNDPRIRIFPSLMAYTEYLIVDSFDETNHVMRFSAQYRP